MNFWQVADASPQRWPTQKSLLEPQSLTFAELIQQICNIPLEKAQAVVLSVCPTSNWGQFKSVTAIELQNAGLTENQSARLLAALEFGKRTLNKPNAKATVSEPEIAAALLQYDLGYSSVEKVALLILDFRHHLIAKDIIAIGSRSECIADPKIIFEHILRNQGSRFILAHNHPSGDSTPSGDDIRLTEKLLQAAQLMNTPMLDHLVITQEGFCSIHRQYPHLWEGYEDD